MVLPACVLHFDKGVLAEQLTSLRLAFSYGTGNATPNLPIVMMECLYASPTYDMVSYRQEEPSNLPPMVVFSESSKFYRKWQKTLEGHGVK